MNLTAANSKNRNSQFDQVPKKQKLDKNNPQHLSFYSKKNKLKDQCPIED